MPSYKLSSKQVAQKTPINDNGIRSYRRDGLIPRSLYKRGNELEDDTLDKRAFYFDTRVVDWVNFAYSLTKVRPLTREIVAQIISSALEQSGADDSGRDPEDIALERLQMHWQQHTPNAESFIQALRNEGFHI